MAEHTRDRIVQAFLALAGLVFLAVGLPGVVDPEALLGRVGIVLPAVDALNEARAMYGGMQLAIAGLFLAGALRPGLWRPLLQLWLLLVGGLVAGRFVSIAVDGPPVGFARVLLGLEIAGAAAGLWVLRLGRARGDAEPAA